LVDSVTSPRENFITAIAPQSREINLARAALYVAAEQEPDLDVVAYLGHIALLSNEARKMLPGRHSVYDAIHTINELMYKVEGFKGNRENYYDPKNCLLNYVIDDKRGIPITLAIIYSEIARRLGHNLRGVGMPGHYLLAAGRGASEVFIDPFNNGGLLSRKECLGLALRGNRVPKGRLAALASRLLPTSDKRSTLKRLLVNLKLMHIKRNESDSALKCAERIQLLDPRDWRNLSELARLQAEVGQYSRAVESFNSFLERAPANTDTSHAEHALKQLKAMKRGS
jgi:regulator of sirC expression with transglutaminase-like and TPR domain